MFLISQYLLSRPWVGPMVSTVGAPYDACEKVATRVSTSTEHELCVDDLIVRRHLPATI
jgi:hypothetical protein